MVDQSNFSLPSYMTGWPTQSASNPDWLNSAYQTYLGRAPDQEGFQYWLDQLNNGADQSAVAQSMRDSPEALITGLYQSYLGRKPDAEGYAHYASMLPQPNGYDTARNEIMNSVEARNYGLGDGYRDQARAATAGINQMPGVFSDYASMVPGYRNVPKSPLEALFGGSNPGQDTINQVSGLLGTIFAPEPEEPAEPAKKKDKPAAKPVRQPADETTARHPRWAGG
jgi:hypothetical protein